MPEEKRTILVVVESLSAEVFLKYLRKIYTPFDQLAVTVEHRRIKDASQRVNHVKKIPGCYYSRTIIVSELPPIGFIGDVNWMQMCIHSLMLRLLDPNANSYSSECAEGLLKEKFFKENPIDVEYCYSIFPEKTVNECALKDQALCFLIHLMSTGEIKHDEQQRRLVMRDKNSELVTAQTEPVT